MARADTHPKKDVRNLRESESDAFGLDINNLDQMMKGARLSAQDRLQSHMSRFKPIGPHLSQDFRDPRGTLVWIVEHSYFDNTIAGLVVINSLLLGLQTEYGAANWAPSDVEAKEFVPYQYVEAVCSCLFAFEFLLRLGCLGVTTCSKTRLLWDLFDGSLVISSLLALAFTSFSTDGQTPYGPNLAPAPILKMARMLRIGRILRMVRLLGKVRLMAAMIFGSMSSLFWLLVLVFIVLYGFSTILTQGALEYKLALEPSMQHPDVILLIDRDFGTIPQSLFTLFLCVTGGVSWGEKAATCLIIGVMYFFTFLFYMFFMFFSVLNIVTGVYVNGAITQGNCDRDARMEGELASRARFLDDVLELLEYMDRDDSGSICWSEFEEAMEDDKVASLMAALGIKTRDVRSLFTMLDNNCDGNINIVELIEGFNRFRGPSHSIDVHQVLSRVNYLIKQQDQLTSALFDIIRCGDISLTGRESHTVTTFESQMTYRSRLRLFWKPLIRTWS